MIIPKKFEKYLNPDYTRLEKVLKRQGLPDRVPFYELFVEPVMIEKMTGMPYSPESVVQWYYRLGHDYVNFEPDFQFTFTRCQAVSDTGENNSDGVREWQVADETGIISSWEDFEKYPWPTPSEQSYKDYDKYVSLLPKGMKLVIRPTGVWENVRRLVNYEPLCYMLYDDPELAAKLFYKVGEQIYGVIKHLFEHKDMSHAFAVIMGDDLAAGRGTLVNPQIYKEHVFPWMKKIAQLAHEHNMPFGLHSCGDNELIMEDLIELGLDAKHSFQDNVMPVEQFKKKYGDRLCVLGGLDIDKMTLLKPEDFRVYCKRVLSECMQGGGYALGTGNSPTTYINLENYYVMIEEGLKAFYK